jgi:hypothetical protein
VRISAASCSRLLMSNAFTSAGDLIFSRNMGPHDARQAGIIHCGRKTFKIIYTKTPAKIEISAGFCYISIQKLQHVKRKNNN